MYLTYHCCTQITILFVFFHRIWLLDMKDIKYISQCAIVLKKCFNKHNKCVVEVFKKCPYCQE